MKIHASGEDYLEAVLVLQKNHGAVRSIDVARRVGVSKASVSYAVSALREGGFLTVDSDYVLHLTETGRNVAEKIYERHQFFTEQFIAAGVDPEIAERDACRIEHAISQDTFEKIRDMLQDSLDTALGQYTLSLAELPRQAADRAELREKITSRKQEIHRLRSIVRSLYENLVQGVLTKDEYFDYKEKYESRIADLAVEMEQLEDGLRTMDAQAEQHRALEQDAAQIKTDRALTGALIERLIDRISSCVSRPKKRCTRLLSIVKTVPAEPQTASQRLCCGLSERVWAGISFSRCGKSLSPQ